MDSLRIAIGLVGASLRGQMSYRRSFLIETVSHLILVGIDILPILFLFEHFPSLAGWGRWEVVFLYGIATTCYGVGDLLSSGLDRMPEIVRTGDFDRLLVRPVSPLLQVMARELALFRVTKIVPGLVALVVAAARLDLAPTPARVGQLAIALGSGVPVYVALYLGGATVCFWTVDSIEMFNAFTHGGQEMSKFPVSIYPAWMRRLFLYLIPIGLVTYFPTIALLGRPDAIGLPAWTVGACPVAGLTFLAVSLTFWRVGVGRYTSTGS